MNKPTETYRTAISKSESKFRELASSVDYEKEQVFALQACQSNDKLMEAAQANPGSLAGAMINVATVGLSLCKSTAYAYLVPRDGAVCLDISYRGFIKIATDTGSILWARADIVYQEDSFEYCGPAKEPIISSNPFKDRGEMVGCYCVAKTKEGDILTEIMTKEQVEKIRQASKGINSKWSPWNNYPEEMWKKVVIKRAAKTWPKTEKTERFSTAIGVVNEHEGIEFQYDHSQEQYDYYRHITNPSNPDPIEYFLFWRGLEVEEKASLLKRYKNTVERGSKTKETERIHQLGEEGQNILDEIIINLNETDDEVEISELTEGLSDAAMAYIKENISTEAAFKLAA